MKVFSFIVSLTVVGLLNSLSHAGLVIRTNLGSNPNAIQSSGIFDVGSQITASFVMQLDNSITNPAIPDVAIYNFSVQYDPTKLLFVSRTESAFGLVPADVDSVNGTLLAGNPTIIASPGFNVLTRFDGTSFNSFQASPFGPTTVGTAVFTVLAPLTGSPTAITPGLFEPLFDFASTNAGVDVTSVIQFSGASVSAVPEPASLVLLAVVVGGVGIARIAKRRRVKSLSD